MPLVKIEIISGKSKVYKTKLMGIVHEALVNNFKIPDHDRRQRLIEYSNENFEVGDRTENYTIIEITPFKGRSLDAKKSLYKEISINCKQELGIEDNDLTIVLNEQPLENWGIRGGNPASELNLGIDVKV
ncbi:MAG: tautomerase family protein [Bacteroidetes bacterium]|nr:tautomerase family protein [Bacteroidota bacterium]